MIQWLVYVTQVAPITGTCELDFKKWLMITTLPHAKFLLSAHCSLLGHGAQLLRLKKYYGVLSERTAARAAVISHRAVAAEHVVVNHV